MATVTDTKPTKTPLFHRVSTTSTKSMAENVKKIAITTDNKLPLLRGIDQVCSKIQKAKYLNNKCTKRHYCRALYYFHGTYNITIDD
jgi:hypothetical protein